MFCRIVALCLVASFLVACGGGDGSAMDTGSTPDSGAEDVILSDSPQMDPGPTDPDSVDPGPPDPGPVDSGPDDAATADPWTSDVECQGEGAWYYSGDLECCPWLDPVPMTQSFGDGTCVPGRAIGSMVCVLKCGDGQCTTGEDSCNCPKDCPFNFPGGPGSPCINDDDCDADKSGLCLPESSGYPTGGFCTDGGCDPSDPYTLCPAGSSCVGTDLLSINICLPTCRKDGDCREGLTCETLPQLPPMPGNYFCWQTSKANPKALPGHALGEACSEDYECLSRVCHDHPTTAGARVCSTFCSTDMPCKEGQVCHPMAGCGDPGPCGACFTL